MAKHTSKKQIKKNRLQERLKEESLKETTFSISKETSSSLMIAHLIGIVLVIAGHYSSKRYIPFFEIRGWNYTFLDFAFNGMARMLIPFFAMSSGFFLAAKLRGKEQYIDMLLNKAKTLFLPYVIASFAIYAFLRIMHWRPYPITPMNFIMDVILHPISMQFWFLRDLIILIVFSPVLLSSKKKFNRILVLVLGVLWFINYQPFPIVAGWYLLNIETIFFFCLGGLLFEYIPLLESGIKMNLRYKVLIFFAWFILIGLRVYIYPGFDIWYVNRYTLTSLMIYKAANLVGIVALVQFSNLFSSNRFLIYLSGFVFFVYLYHLVPLYDFLHMYNKLLEPKYSFYLNFPIALIVVFAAGYLISKILPGVFEFITGGRDPNKMIKRIN